MVAENVDGIVYGLPEIPPAKRFRHVLPEVMTLDNGMPVWYVRKPGVPLVSMNLVFPRGASGDPLGHAGITSFAGAMLKEGAAGRSAQQVSADIEFIGASLGVNVKMSSSFITLQVLTQYLDKALDIVADIWLKPDFTDDAFERLRRIALTRLRQRADVPGALAALAGDYAYFGPEHPYGFSSDGYISVLESCTKQEIYDAYKRAFCLDGAAFIAIGDLPAEEFRARLNARFGSVAALCGDASVGGGASADAAGGAATGGAAAPKGQTGAPGEPKLPGRKLVIVDKPDAPQTVIRIMQPGVAGPSLKTFEWQLVNIPFGGSFTSRLMQNIREDKGYTYGAGSHLLTYNNTGVFVSSADVASEVTGAALSEFLYELGRLPEGNFEEDEFARARETWKSELVQSFETHAGIVVTFSGIYLNGKHTDAINTFGDKMESMTLADFNNMARQFPKFDNMVIVLVGDKDKILPQIRDLDLPAPIFADTEGRPIVVSQ